MIKPNTLIVRPDGPLQFEGEMTLEDGEGNLLQRGDEAWLCRCGQSQDKPFCDGAHKRCGFSDPARFDDERHEVLATPNGPLQLTLKTDAMLIARGPLSIRSKDGTSSTTRNRAALCRCGQSQNKPFCDASHKQCGFRG
ncbi:MAG: CDGSH iron-sulfur domain-containing protein [Thiohalophilus sp.]|uniref:CDGSH iron-sulfur domain-containing protein n=1 Tax=Thiohalophilus sp. TaxID=3028392 RepID=UPI0028708466|nr:CDGSH iron-sulfur domain-containing protein [Thiohalophilus sp.]MDR9436140.1 CDGSH iron-sulfur domain-containing protein [Thiohalophilus sp.]